MSDTYDPSQDPEKLEAVSAITRRLNEMGDSELAYLDSVLDEKAIFILAMIDPPLGAALAPFMNDAPEAPMQPPAMPMPAPMPVMGVLGGGQ